MADSGAAAPYGLASRNTLLSTYTIGLQPLTKLLFCLCWMRMWEQTSSDDNSVERGESTEESIVSVHHLNRSIVTLSE